MQDRLRLHAPFSRHATQGFTAAGSDQSSTCHRSPALGTPRPHSSPPRHVPARASLSPSSLTGSPAHAYTRSPYPVPATAPTAARSLLPASAARAAGTQLGSPHSSARYNRYPASWPTAADSPTGQQQARQAAPPPAHPAPASDSVASSEPPTTLPCLLGTERTPAVAVNKTGMGSRTRAAGPSTPSAAPAARRPRQH